MQVTLNGEALELPAPLTLEELLRRLGVEPGRVAIEHNRQIIKRERWMSVQVQAGDRVEIVHFVGGG